MQTFSWSWDKPSKQTFCGRIITKKRTLTLTLVRACHLATDTHTQKNSIENHFKTAGGCCSRLPRQRRWRRKELLHPQSRALQLSVSSHVRCVGEWRLWFLCLCRPVGFISGCTALLLDILLQRRHLLFSSWNLMSVCDQSLPVKRKQYWSIAVVFSWFECVGCTAAYGTGVVQHLHVA